MSGAATEQAVRAFSEAGFAVVRGAVSAERIAALRAELAVVLARVAASPEGGAQPVWQALQPRLEAPSVLAALRDVGALVAGCLGAAGVQLLQDAVVAKPARVGGPVAWHQDHAYTAWLTPPGSLSVRVALTPETAESGALVALYGSHRWPLHVERQFGAETLGADPRARTGLDAATLHAAERVLTLAPGDVSLHHSRTLHMSGPNRSGVMRQTLVAHVVDAAVRLADPKGPMAPYALTTAEGHLDSGAFPRLF